MVLCLDNLPFYIARPAYIDMVIARYKMPQVSKFSLSQSRIPAAREQFRARVLGPSIGLPEGGRRKVEYIPIKATFELSLPR